MELSDILEVVEVDMITSSTYTRSLAIGYGNNGDQEELSLFKEKEKGKIESFNHACRRKEDFENTPNHEPIEAISFHNEEKVHQKRSCRNHLKDHMDSKVKVTESTLGTYMIQLHNTNTSNSLVMIHDAVFTNALYCKD